MRFLLRSAVLAILSCLALAAVDRPEVIRLGFASAGVGGRPFASSSTIAAVHAKGLLEEEFKADGIRVEWVFHKGAGPAVNEALAGGLLDFSTQGDFPSILGRAGGLRTRIIAAMGVRSNTYLAVPKGSLARSLRDLLGKRVAYHRGTNATLGIARILHSHGLSDADFRTINLDGSTAAVAIASGEIDAVWGSGLVFFDLERRGVVDVIDGTRGKDPRLTLQAHLLVTEDFERRHPRIVQRVVDVVVREAAWESDEANRDAVFALWAKSGYPVEAFVKEFRDTPLAARVTPLIDEFFVTRYQDAVDTSLRLKLIRRGFPIGAWIEPTYVQSAIGRLGLVGRWPEHDAAGQPKAVAGQAGR